MCLNYAIGGGGEVETRSGATVGWDPSQQIQGLKCPSQPNPNKNNIETCSVKLPQDERARDIFQAFPKTKVGFCIIQPCSSCDHRYQYQTIGSFDVVFCCCCWWWDRCDISHIMSLTVLAQFQQFFQASLTSGVGLSKPVFWKVKKWWTQKKSDTQSHTNMMLAVTSTLSSATVHRLN